MSNGDPPLYINAIVDKQLQSSQDEIIRTSATSRVLIIYTGGTIGMKNHHQHGYTPVPGFLTETLKSMRRFHDSSLSPEDYPDRSQTNLDQTGEDSHVPITSTVNLPLRYQIPDWEGVKMVDAIGRTQGSDEPSVFINGTPVTRVKLPAMVTPPSLYGKRIKFSVLEYDPLMDSSNMTMTDWVKIATDIEVNYQLFDAFLVLHGTDTMAYTASALSFMLEELGKTVIITGSQVPLAEIRNDAVENLLGALTIAGHFVIPEVTLFFAQKLFRGNRASKVDAYDFKAFDSPNFKPLVSVGINIDVVWSEVRRPTAIARFRAEKRLNPSVAALRLFPGITEATVRAFLSPPIKGVVLETYGSGNAPNNRPELL
ncbi:hypothetical protein HDU76_013780, partial [Blyttiomyces sp. JEL0837]